MKSLGRRLLPGPDFQAQADTYGGGGSLVALFTVASRTGYSTPEACCKY